MKKCILFLAFFFSCVSFSFSQEKTSGSKISILRKYDAVLGIEKNMKVVYEFQNKSYPSEIPVSEYGPITLTEAFDGYRKLAEQGNADALYALGNYYRNNEKIFRHHELAFGIFGILCQMDYVPGIHSLGYMYAEGLGTERNIEKAVACYEMAAREKFPNSLVNLAHLYFQGDGVPKDVEKGLALVEEAVQYKEESEGALVLADIYSEYVPYGDYLRKAERLYLKAEQLGNKNALGCLADFYDANGPKPDDAKEAEYYRKAVVHEAEVGQKIRSRQRELLQCLLEQEKNGSSDCYERIADIYTFYGRSNPDYKKYYEYLLKAAEGGNCNAMTTVGNAYASGNYFDEDKAKAACWLRKSYEGNPEIKITLYYLMNLYMNSIIGLPEYLRECIRDYNISGGAGFWEDYSVVKAEEAFSFFKKLADSKKTFPWENKSQRQAYYSVGFCYAKGIGTEKDMNLARQYGYQEPEKYIRTPEEYAEEKALYAAEQKSEIDSLLRKIKSGSAESKDYYEFAQKYLVTQSQRNMEKAYPYIVKACEMQNPAALNLLASWYKEGRYVQFSLEKAAELNIKSAELGNQWAIAEVKSIYRYGFGVEQDCDKEIEWAQKRDPLRVYDRDVERYLVESDVMEDPEPEEGDWFVMDEDSPMHREDFYFDGSTDSDEIGFYDYEVSKDSEYKAPHDLTVATNVLESFLSSFLSGGEEWKDHVYLEYSNEIMKATALNKFLKYRMQYVNKLKEFDISFNKEMMRIPAADKYHSIKVYIYLETFSGETESGYDDVMMFFSKEKGRWYVEQLPE